MAFRVSDPPQAMNSFGRGLAVACDSGNRFIEMTCASFLAGLETEHGDPQAGLDLLTRATSGFHDAGDTASTQGPLAGLALFLARSERHEPGAILAGYATNPLSLTAHPPNWPLQRSTYVPHSAPTTTPRSPNKATRWPPPTPPATHSNKSNRPEDCCEPAVRCPKTDTDRGVGVLRAIPRHRVRCASGTVP